MASSVSLTSQVSKLYPSNGRTAPSLSPCNLTSNANIVSSGRQMLACFSYRKNGSSYRAIKVNALFGGKKDNSEKGDDSPSK
ncbi:hypothetical protein CRG98_027286, partial [Punica granatum]